MSWRDNLREASFRGVPFFYHDTEAEIGRRFQAHEYPGQNHVYHEDLGAKTKTHRQTAYVWGPDALEKAATLRAAINQPGPGSLMHPIEGELTVVCTDARERHTTKEGGYVAFVLTFAVTGAVRNPQLRVATAAQVEAASNGALIAVQGGFEEAFNVDGLPEFVAEDAQAQAVTAIDAIKTAFDDLQRVESDAAVFVNKVANVKDRVSSLVRNPALLAQDLADLIGLRSILPGTDVARAVTRLFSYGEATSTPAFKTVTPSRLRQQGNRVVMAAFVRQVAIIEAAHAVPNQTFNNRKEALARRDEIAEALEAESMTAGDDVYWTFADLRAAVIKDVNIRAAKLPQLTSITPMQTRPALALAHEIYGDDPAKAIAMADEMVTRNDIRHPGFVTGGRALEVLIDV